MRHAGAKLPSRRPICRLGSFAIQLAAVTPAGCHALTLTSFAHHGYSACKSSPIVGSITIADNTPHQPIVSSTFVVLVSEIRRVIVLSYWENAAEPGTSFER